MPSHLKLRSFDTSELDKVFACTWLNADHVIMGTKCNKLIVMNVNTGSRVVIPQALDTSVARVDSDMTVIREGTGSQDVEMNRVLSEEENGGDGDMEEESYVVDRKLSHLSNRPFFFNLVHHPLLSLLSPTSYSFQRLPTYCTGIHSLSINPERSMLAVGGGTSGFSSDSIQIFHLPTFTPLAVLKGHTDMIFNVTWTSNRHLMSASRDTKVMSWYIPDEVLLRSQLQFLPPYCPLPIISSTQSHLGHTTKVRDMGWDAKKRLMASLDGGGKIMVWNLADRAGNERVTETCSWNLVGEQEFVCLEADVGAGLFVVR